MRELPIEVSSSGGILLGQEVVCDGFHINYPARVQTHIHLDHMTDFDRSKGFQNIYMTRPTRRLLEMELDAELPIRSNLVVVEPGVPTALENCTLTLFRSGHMLGSAQVVVESASGTRLGYSGDFQWPNEEPIQVDALVVDSTYGSPVKERQYTQGEVESRFLELIVERLRHGPVHVRSHRGTVQRALQLLEGHVDCIVLGSERFIAEASVYREFGYTICDIVPEKSLAGKEARSAERYIRFYGKGDRLPVDLNKGSMIVLSAYMARPDDPVLTYSERAFSVAMSNHADFLGTIEYVKATGATFVLTDNTRGRGVELALELKARLGIEARPSHSELSYEWGM